MNTKPLSNTAVATAIKSAFAKELALSESSVKVTVTGAGEARNASVNADGDVYTGLVDVDSGVISAILQGAFISLAEWAKLGQKAADAAEKAHAKVLKEFLDARKKTAKKAEAKRKENEKKAQKKLAEKRKADDKKLKAMLKKTKKPALPNGYTQTTKTH